MTTPPPPPVPEEQPSNGELVTPQNDDDKTYGMLAHGGVIILGFVAPLLVLLLKGESPFAQQEAKESLNFQILIFIAATISALLIFALIGCILLPVVIIADYALAIMATMKVNSGEGYRYPFNWRIIK